MATKPTFITTEDWKKDKVLRDSIVALLDDFVASVYRSAGLSKVVVEEKSGGKQEGDKIRLWEETIYAQTTDSKQFSKEVAEYYMALPKIRLGLGKTNVTEKMRKDHGLLGYSFEFSVVDFNPTLQIRGVSKDGKVELTAILTFVFLFKVMKLPQKK
jgi:hypothetical protein